MERLVIDYRLWLGCGLNKFTWPKSRPLFLHYFRHNGRRQNILWLSITGHHFFDFCIRYHSSFLGSMSVYQKMLHLSMLIHSNYLRLIDFSLQLVLCRVKAVKSLPYIIHSRDHILFQSFEIRRYILNYWKNLIGLDSCSRLSFLNPLDLFDATKSLNRLPYHI